MTLSTILHAMATPSTYWLVAARKPKGRGQENTLTDLKSMIGKFSDGDPKAFSISSGEDTLKFGAFDNLIRLTDDLNKSDSQIEGTLRRIERQLLELEPEAQVQITSQKQEKTVNEYLTNWKWDGGKFPRDRLISENCSLLMNNVGKLDEAVRTQSGQYNETKTALGNLKEKEGGNLLTKDLVDVLIPSVVKENDFIYETHLTTVVVVVPKDGKDDLLKCYETLGDCDVVPRSAKQIHGDDKEGNTLWRIVMFKTSVESFRKASREKRFTVRDFEYSSDGFENIKKQRAEYEGNLSNLFTKLNTLCNAAFSDVFVMWIHVKAMRIFVESTLRFGSPPVFDSYIIMPNANRVPQVRAALGSIFSAKQEDGEFSSKQLQDAAEAEGEEYFPYVSFAFSPFSGKM